MIKKRLLEMSKELEDKIIKLCYSISEIGIDSVEFEYWNDIKKDFFKIYISENKYGWEVINSRNSGLNHKSQRDMYTLGFDKKELEYDYSEED